MSVSYLKVLTAGLIIAVLSGCTEPVANSIYINGQIISVNDNIGTVEAIAVKDGNIIALGSNSDIRKYQGETTKLINLQGKTMLPGFVDAHSHLSGVAIQAVSANLLPAPDGRSIILPSYSRLCATIWACPLLWQNTMW